MGLEQAVHILGARFLRVAGELDPDSMLDEAGASEEWVGEVE
jgi:hypothetical protein